MPEHRDGLGDEREDEREDEALLAAHVAGDPTAFAELVSRHRDRLWAVALRTCGHREDAADGLQDGLVAAYRRAETYRGDAAVTTWLHRVVVNACLDRLRTVAVRRTEPLDDLAEHHGAATARAGAGAGGGTLVGTGASASAGDPAELVVVRDRRSSVVAALAALPVEQRAALVLVDLEGFSVAEAAEILDCPTGTVKSRCSRGRAALALLLRPLLDQDAEVTRATPPVRNRWPAPAVTPPKPPRGPPGPA